MKSNGQVPEELAYIFLMDRMHCNWSEFQATPSSVIEDYLLVMRSEAMFSKEKS
jgi:hypothetical protein